MTVARIYKAPLPLTFLTTSSSYFSHSPQLSLSATTTMAKSKKQQRKPLRQGQNRRSTPKKSLCDMPPELQLHISSFLPLSDRKNLTLVCRHFNDLLRRELFLDILRDCRDKEVVLCLKDEEESESSGTKVPWIRRDLGPFVIRELELGPLEDDDNGGEEGECFNMLVYSPVILRPDESYEALDMEVSCVEVEIVHDDDDWEDEWANRDKSRDTIITWVSVEKCRQTIVPCTGGIIRKNYECPECHGNRFICPGCGGVSQR